LNDPLADPYRWQQHAPETYWDHLRAALATGPDRPFLHFEEGVLTFADLDRQSLRMANALAALGVQPGQTVVTLLDSSIDAVVAWFAINRIGAIWVPINTAYKGEFLRHQVDDAGAVLVVCEPEYLTNLEAVAARLPQLELVLVREAAPASATLRVEPLDAHRGTDETPIAFEPQPADIACLIYTSGTTGRSKGCMVSHNYLCNGGRQQNIAIPPLPGGMTWSSLPMFHVSISSYVILATLIAKAQATIARRFSVTSFWDEIEACGATTAMLMASMFPLLAQAPDNPAMLRCKGRLRAVSGVPLATEIRTIWHERFGVGHMNSFGYGQTEASKICNLPWGDPLPPLTSAGKPSIDFEVMIADGNGMALPAGTPGEILVRPKRPNIMAAGYWRQPEHTVKVWKDLWLHTGDVGKLDEQGYMYFVDRQKDYVRSRGENISSIEIETVIMGHAEVSEVAFHAVPTAGVSEDDLKITVVRSEGSQLQEEALCRWAIEALPYFAVPRFIEFRTELPKTPTGRVQKAKLREDGRTPATWDAHEAGLVVRRSARRN
jgi:crotonobetaine/carnitine-CoA ligase